MSIKIGKRVKVIVQPGAKLLFLLDGKAVPNVRALDFSIAGGQLGHHYVEVMGKKDDGVSYELAKEMHKAGFHTAYCEDGDWTELYFDEGGTAMIDKKPLVNMFTGQRKNG